MPFYANDAFTHATGLFLGTLIGFGFGFILERAGFGRARNLVAQFFLNDMRVLKVMFSAIVTALLGLTVLGGFGVVDLAKVTVPETFIGPHIVGGLLLGAGFIISGYCPGTGVVAAASGNLDGLFSLVGVIVGSMIFGFAYDPLEKFYLSGAMGSITLHQFFGIPMSVVTIGVVVMAVGAFIGAEKVEEIVNGKAGTPLPDGSVAIRNKVFAGFGVAGLLGLALLPLAKPTAVAAVRAPGQIEPLELARLLFASPGDLYILDLRKPGGKGTIPGAQALPADDPAAAFAAELPPTRRLVVFGSGSQAPELPPGVARFPGEVLVLKGGYEAFEQSVLTAPAAPENPAPALVAEFRLKNAYYSHFSGAAAAPAPVSAPRPVPAPVRAASKKGGGC